MGLRPDLTGQGCGQAYLSAILVYLTQIHPSVPLRTTVASWNQRALRLCLGSGFHEIARFNSTRKEQTEYVVLMRSLRTS